MFPVIYISATCYLLLLQCTSSAHTSPILSHYCFIMHVFSESQAQYSKKKTEQSLQSASRIGKTRLDALMKSVVSFDEDCQRSSVVDDPIRHTPASQVLALTSRCHMWLHVAYGVYLVLLLNWLNCICLAIYCEYDMPSCFWYILHMSINHVITSN